MAYDWLDAMAMQVARGAKAIFRSETLRGGRNSTGAPQYIADQQASILENVAMKDPLRPEVRDGFALIQSAQTGIDAALLALRINSFGVVSPTGTTATGIFITIPNAAAGRTYVNNDVTGAWVECTYAGPTSYDPGAAQDVPSAQLNDCYYILGSTPIAFQAPGGALTGTISSNTDDLAAVLGSPPHNGVDICYAFGRGWILTADCKLNYSIFLPTAAGINASWARTGTLTTTTSAGRIQMSPNASNVPRAVIPWGNSTLLVFFDNSIEQVGAMSASVVPFYTDPFTYANRSVLEPRFGLIARRAKAAIGDDVYFMDQYGAVRSLAQTVKGTQAGMQPLPISESIKDEIPGRLNFGAASKVFFVIEGEELHIFYPRDGSTQCNAKAVFNLSYGCWQSIDPLPRDQGFGLVSDIRGDGANGFEMFTTNGEDSGTVVSKVYRWKPGTYTDDGEPIVYTEWTKSLHYGCPEADKLFRRLEAGFIGDVGVVITVSAQIDEDGRIITVLPEYEIPTTVATDFPILDSDFPILDSDFPLVDGAPGITRNRWLLNDLKGQQSGRGRMIRFAFQFSTTSTGKWAQRAEWWATAIPQPRPEMS